MYIYIKVAGLSVDSLFAFFFFVFDSNFVYCLVEGGDNIKWDQTKLNRIDEKKIAMKYGFYTRFLITYLLSTLISFSNESSFPLSAFLSIIFTANSWLLFSLLSAKRTSEKAPLKWKKKTTTKKHNENIESMTRTNWMRERNTSTGINSVAVEQKKLRRRNENKCPLFPIRIQYYKPNSKWNEIRIRNKPKNFIFSIRSFSSRTHNAHKEGDDEPMSVALFEW